MHSLDLCILNFLVDRRKWAELTPRRDKGSQNDLEQLILKVDIRDSLSRERVTPNNGAASTWCFEAKTRAPNILVSMTGVGHACLMTTVQLPESSFKTEGASGFCESHASAAFENLSMQFLDIVSQPNQSGDTFGAQRLDSVHVSARG
jgi:hypothetical protein